MFSEKPQPHNSKGKYKFKLQCDKIVHAPYGLKFKNLTMQKRRWKDGESHVLTIEWKLGHIFWKST